LQRRFKAHLRKKICEWRGDPLCEAWLFVAVRELGKTLSPSKCRVTEIHETGSRNNYRKKGLYLRKKVMK
jgi:hypothetical protein